MTDADDRARLIAEILTIEPGLAPLDCSTLAQLRELCESMQQQRADYAAAGLVDSAARG